MSKTEEGKQDKELDCSNAGRGVWLVKVPKYIAKKWLKGEITTNHESLLFYVDVFALELPAQDEEEVGKLKIIKYPGQKSTVSLSLSDKILLIDAEEKIPKDHRFDVQAVNKQTLGVFSHNGKANELIHSFKVIKVIPT